MSKVKSWIFLEYVFLYDNFINIIRKNKYIIKIS